MHRLHLANVVLLIGVWMSVQRRGGSVMGEAVGGVRQCGRGVRQCDGGRGSGRSEAVWCVE